MIQKDIKKPKFSYYASQNPSCQQNQHDRLLKQYMSLNPSPNKKYQYCQQLSNDKNKQNIIKNYTITTLQSTLGYKNNNITRNNKLRSNKNNQQTITFSKNNYNKQDDRENNRLSQTQTMRFNGNNIHNIINNNNPTRIQFSPYDQTQTQGCQLSHNAPPSNLLIYQYQQQFNILKQQLCQYEYQNQLLRSKLSSKQQQNNELKTKQHLINDKLILYEIEKQKNYKLIDQMKEEIKILLMKNNMLEDQIKIKQEQIIIITNQYQWRNAINKQEQQRKSIRNRRKSLDINKLTRNINNIHNHNNINRDFVIQQDYQNHTNTNTNKQNTIKQRSKYIGKLMNMNSINLDRKNNPNIDKSLNTNQNSHQISSYQQLSQKSLNFIQSIKTMYLKINKNTVSDLKQLWKWLKNLAHQNQLIKILKQMKISLMAVLDYLETKKQNDQLEFMERQWLRVVAKIVGFLFTNQQEI